MRNTKSCLVAGLLAISLSGCQGSPFDIFGSKKGVRQASSALGNNSGVLAFEEGRAHLREGQISAAVASFKIARLDPAVAADASNGLGVAYARLGRPDIADRYFREALRRAPEDERFVANLLRLQKSVMLAKASHRTAPELAGEDNGASKQTQIAPQIARKPREHRIQAAGIRPPVLRITLPEPSGNAPNIAVLARETVAQESSPDTENTRHVAEADAMLGNSASKVMPEPKVVSFTRHGADRQGVAF